MSEVGNGEIKFMLNINGKSISLMGLKSVHQAMSGKNIILLIVTGDLPKEGSFVFDVDSVQHIREVVANLNPSLVKKGQEVFTVGGVLTPDKKNPEEVYWQYQKMLAKINVGADFIILQSSFNPVKLWEVLRYCSENNINTSIIANNYIPTPIAAHRIFTGEVPGFFMSEELYKKIMAENNLTSDSLKKYFSPQGRKAALDRATKLAAIIMGMNYQSMHFGGMHFGGKFFTLKELENVIQRARAMADQWEQLMDNFAAYKSDSYYLYYNSSRQEQEKKSSSAKQMIISGCGYYAFKIAHNIAFKPKAPLFLLFQGVYKLIYNNDVRSAKRIMKMIEQVLKVIIFDCRSCGDCRLHETYGVCPMRCPKNTLNGPCGGSENGGCEECSDIRECIWMEIYRRAKIAGDLDKPLIARRVRDFSLQNTDSWATWFLRFAEKVKEVKTNFIIK